MDIKKEIRRLRAFQKIQLIDFIYESLDKPDLDVQEEWIKESEKRFDNYKTGKVKSYSYEEVMKMIDQ